jgi:hypothetical protein
VEGGEGAGSNEGGVLVEEGIGAGKVEKEDLEKEYVGREVSWIGAAWVGLASS